MWIKSPSIHISLKSTETESEPFSLPRHGSGREYYINIATKTDSVPDKIVLKKKVPDDIDSTTSRWDTLFVWQKDNRQPIYNCAHAKESDSRDTPRVAGGEQEYQIVVDKPGVIVYFTTHELPSPYANINKDVVDYVCLMNESIEELTQLVDSLKTTVDGISGRIHTLERCVYEGEDSPDA